MTLLEDARRLANGPVPTFWDSEPTGTVGRLGPDTGPVLKCAHCKQKLHAHLPDCPWPAMPRIVAALEAYDDLMQQFADDRNYHEDCGPIFEPFDLPSLGALYVGREPTTWLVNPTPGNEGQLERHQRLVAVLRGDVP